MQSEFIKNDFEKRKDFVMQTLLCFAGTDIPQDIKEKVNRNIRVLNKVLENARKEVTEIGYITTRDELEKHYPLFREVI